MDQRATIEWRDGRVPIATRFDDPYYSLDDGLAETEFVFLTGNDLPARFAPGFHIAELGFGTALSAILAWRAWTAAGMTTPLRFTSFEAFPMSQADRAKSLALWPEIAPDAAALAQGLGDGTRFQTATLDLTIVTGDARQTVPTWTGQADAWFLDGFSPAKNPELWDPALLAQVGQRTTASGTCATYTAAGHVRRALADAGFTVTRIPGFGRKRHMTRGTKA